MLVYLYVLQSQKDSRYYTGITNNIDRRLAEHNTGKNKSTKHRTPFILKCTVEFDSYENARKVEKTLKRYTKTKVESFINKVMKAKYST